MMPIMMFGYTWLSVHEVNVRMKNSLYGYFIGKKLVFPVVEGFVHNNWKKYGLKKVMMAKGFFSFKFSYIEGVDSVLQDGPWMIRGILNFLNKWSPSMSLLKKELSRVPVWELDKQKKLFVLNTSGNLFVVVHACYMVTHLMILQKLLNEWLRHHVAIKIALSHQAVKVMDLQMISIFFLLVTLEALNADNLVIEEVATINKATTSGTQEKMQSSTILVEKINVFEKQIWKENLCL
nr:hypothetical protein [Tanacetum cinerariifolium]